MKLLLPGLKRQVWAWGTALWCLLEETSTLCSCCGGQEGPKQRGRGMYDSHNVSDICAEFECCLYPFLLEDQNNVFTIKSSVGENQVCIREISCRIHFKAPHPAMAWHRADFVFCQQNPVSCVPSNLAVILRVVLWCIFLS